jgi:hypothetical protein
MPDVMHRVHTHEVRHDDLLFFVMAGLGPAIHDFFRATQKTRGWPD